jgi:hypothetical protein
MKKLIIITLTILMAVSIPFNLLLWVSLVKERDQNQILLFENLNLRGYKNVYLDHLEKCDSIGDYFLRQRNLIKEDSTQ